jgi:hypothetical protein
VRWIWRRLASTSFRTFVLYPIVVLSFELLLHEGNPRLNPWFLPLLAWGYLQYFLVGRYRIRLGGGGPGMDTPPERLVTSGPFALCRNPIVARRGARDRHRGVVSVPGAARRAASHRAFWRAVSRVLRAG